MKYSFNNVNMVLEQEGPHEQIFIAIIINDNTKEKKSLIKHDGRDKTLLQVLHMHSIGLLLSTLLGHVYYRG